MGKRSKIGRPPLPRDQKKRHLIAFKLDDAEVEALKQKAKELGISKSEAIREAINRFIGRTG
jgi:Ribbon-helix-helix protein, copG family